MALQSLYDKAAPAFDAMGKKSFYLDDVGGGAKMKLVVNMIMGRYFNYTPSFPAVKMFHGTLLWTYDHAFQYPGIKVQDPSKSVVWEGCEYLPVVAKSLMMTPQLPW